MRAAAVRGSRTRNWVVVSVETLEGVSVFGDRGPQEKVVVVRSAFGEVVVELRTKDWQEQNGQGHRGHNLDRHSPQRRPQERPGALAPSTIGSRC